MSIGKKPYLCSWESLRAKNNTIIEISAFLQIEKAKALLCSFDN